MAKEKMSPLRARMIEDMRIRGMGDKAQKAHIRALKDFTAFLGRSPDTATPDDLRAYQLHMADAKVTPPTFNARITALRFFFGMTCDREDMKKYMQFRTELRKLPIVLSVEEVSAVLGSAPGPGMKYRAALSIGYGAGLRGEQPEGPGHRQRPHADPCRARQGRQGSRRDAVSLLAGTAAGLLARGATARLAVSGSKPGRADVATLFEPGVQLSQAHGRNQEARHAALAEAQLRDASPGGRYGRTGDPGAARPCQAGPRRRDTPMSPPRRCAKSPARSNTSGM